MPIVTPSPKGQVVIAKKERDKLGLKPGSKVMVKAASHHIEGARIKAKHPLSYADCFVIQTSYV